ncbi:MAG TPA: tetratricopeptide repeat protein [Pyrinomonadaceae bacterium]|nr:tetratricopeptide repeat protein [Pyrinomonadaceae bacterium]
MIFCNKCGNSIVDGLRFCTECGTEMPDILSASSMPTMRGSGAAAAPALAPTVEYQRVGPTMLAPPAMQHPADTPVVQPYAPAPAPAPSPNSKILVAIGGIAILAIALAIYFAVRSPRPGIAPTSNTPSVLDAGNSWSTEDEMASFLQSALNEGRLVTSPGNDAFTYYKKLTGMNSQNKALSGIKNRVFAQLRSMGDDAITKRVNHTEGDNPDWTTPMRALEWAHMLEPSDRQLEARWRYAEGREAYFQQRKSDAWRSISTASQLDSSWAVPLNDLGILRTDDRASGDQRWRDAISYYQRAMNLKSDWDILNNNMGTAYFYLENYDEAARWYNRAIQLNSNWARPHKWLGQIYEKRGDSSTAIQEYQAAANLFNPNTDSSELIEFVKGRLRALRGY